MGNPSNNPNNVTIKYNGTTFGQNSASQNTRLPCPLISIDTKLNKDVDNNLLSEVNTITLEGMILGTGIQDLIVGYSGVVNFFKDPNKQSSIFEIVCGSSNNNTFTAGNGFIVYSGTTFISANAAKNENNWTTTLPYSVVLESTNPLTPSGVIESYEDNWTFEPLEDISYYIINQDMNVYTTTSNTNPTILPNTPVYVAPGTPETRRFNMEGFLQYRITHRLSATGKSTKNANPNNPNPSNTVNTNNNKILAHQNAALWVADRLSKSVNTNVVPPVSGVAIKPTPLGNVPNIGLFLYNHVRSIDSSPSAGTYGVTDTWLALGTGVKHTEDFTWEVSTDELWIQTVTMNGTIKGLEPVNNNYTMMTGLSATGIIDNTYGLFPPKYSSQNASTAKYRNALSAYTSGIKPFLYNRASSVLGAIVPSSTSSDPNTSTGSTSATTSNNVWFGPTGRILNLAPTSFNETLNPIAGTITYSVSYNTKPAPLLSGAVNATISITDNNSADIVAEAFVLGRPLGPVLQKVGKSRGERQISLEATYPVPTGFDGIHPQSPRCIIYHTSTASSPAYSGINMLIESLKPVGSMAFSSLQGVPLSAYPMSLNGQVFRTSDTETWNPFEGRYSRNVTWIYNTGTCI